MNPQDPMGRADLPPSWRDWSDPRSMLPPSWVAHAVEVEAAAQLAVTWGEPVLVDPPGVVAVPARWALDHGSGWAGLDAAEFMITARGGTVVLLRAAGGSQDQPPWSWVGVEPGARQVVPVGLPPDDPGDLPDDPGDDLDDGREAL
jgi:hypothetical protein